MIADIRLGKGLSGTDKVAARHILAAGAWAAVIELGLRIMLFG